VVSALAGWACESSRSPGGYLPDLVPPTITLSTAKTPPAIDTQKIANGLHFTASATDNLALNDIRLVFSGGLIDTTDTVFFNQTLKTVTLPVNIVFPGNSGAGGLINIVGRATDGRGNFAEDTLVIFLDNVNALSVVLVSPAPGALASQGRYVPIIVHADQTGGIQRVGWVIGGVAGQTAVTGDSVTLGVPFPATYDFIDSVLVTGTTGTFTITGFAIDAGNRRGVSATVVVTIQSAANDVTPPRVEQFVTLRAESTDSITVHATDPSGITRVGFIVRDTLGATIGGDSLNYAGNSTDISHRFSMALFGITVIPPNGVRVIVQAFAIDGATGANRGVAGATFTVPSPTGPARTDTVTIVAGITKTFPRGGKMADAIFNATRGELYLTNTPLSRVEVFQVANTSFVASGIPTGGPQPWGIALWPRDTVGNYGDSVVVADAGGTEMSILDVNSRALRWRQDLPNYEIEKYNVVQVAGGVYVAHILIHDLSDRPQYVATVCRAASASTLCHADSVFALYSTTPTVSSSSPFNGRGTVRMEKLINTNVLTFPADNNRLFGHFFWEIGGQGASDVTDTLRVLMRRGLPYNDTQVILSACAGVTINFETFGMGDSTFARNSGNFTHAFLGEGGNAGAAYRRVMSYTTRALLAHGASTLTPGSAYGVAGACYTSPDTLNGPADFGFNEEDFGMSPAVDVRDFISNTGVHVSSIATNFTGGTNVVRADSIYVLDEGLRLKGISPAPLGAFGMDMNYNHAFAAGQQGTPPGNPSDRVVFAADPDGNILVFDTFYYGLIGSIPVRDPIIGPLRVAKDLSGNQLLFGVTPRGLVMVRLPVFPNPFPAPPRLNKVRHSP
jgi:hypothetical protein